MIQPLTSNLTLDKFLMLKPHRTNDHELTGLWFAIDPECRWIGPEDETKDQRWKQISWWPNIHISLHLKQSCSEIVRELQSLFLYIPAHILAAKYIYTVAVKQNLTDWTMRLTFTRKKMRGSSMAMALPRSTIKPETENTRELPHTEKRHKWQRVKSKLFLFFPHGFPSCPLSFSLTFLFSWLLVVIFFLPM